MIPAAALQQIDVRRYRDAASAIAAACQELHDALRVLGDWGDDHGGVDPEVANYGHAGTVIAIVNAVIDAANTARGWVR